MARTLSQSGDSIKTPSQTITSIQILRGLAALAVVLRHIAKEIPGNPFEIGQIGVDIFFVISGFVIFLSAPKIPPAEFALRRLLRVVPLYWLFLALTIVADIARHRTDSAYAFSNALLSFAFIPSHDHAGSMFPPLVVGWSLNFEVFFYLIAGTVLFTLSRDKFLRGLTVVIGCTVVLGFVVRQLVGISAAPVTILLLPITVEFLAGAWVAHWWSGGSRPTPTWGGVLILGSIIWLAFAPSQTPYSTWRPFAWGVPAFAFVVGLLAFEHRLKSTALWPLHRLGDASYSLYLAHPIVIGIVLAAAGNHLVNLPPAATIAIVAALSTAAGVATHLLLERPLLKITRHITTKKDRRLT